MSANAARRHRRLPAIGFRCYRSGRSLTTRSMVTISGAVRRLSPPPPTTSRRSSTTATFTSKNSQKKTWRKQASLRCDGCCLALSNRRFSSKRLASILLSLTMPLSSSAAAQNVRNDTSSSRCAAHMRAEASRVVCKLLNRRSSLRRGHMQRRALLRPQMAASPAATFTIGARRR